MTKCMICASEQELEYNKLQVDSFYQDIFIHWQCHNTPEYQAWVTQQRHLDALYNRYWEMMTLGKSITCPQCHQSQKISPKAVGMEAGIWSINCTNCHRLSPRSFHAYTDSENYEKLERLREDFVCSRELESIETRIAEIEASIKENNRTKYKPRQTLGISAFITFPKCDCGGKFSLQAKPRCCDCNAILLDSYFHISFK